MMDVLFYMYLLLLLFDGDFFVISINNYIKKEANNTKINRQDKREGDRL